MPKKSKNLKKKIKKTKKPKFDSIANLIKKMTDDKVSKLTSQKSSLSQFSKEISKQKNFNGKKKYSKTCKKPSKKTISSITKKTHNLIDKNFLSKIHKFPHNISKAKKGRFLQNVLKNENFHSNFESLYNYTENEIISIKMIERLREKIDANLYNTQIIDFNIDDVNLIIHDFENFEMNFNKFFFLFAEIKRIREQVLITVICPLLEKVLRSLDILEGKVFELVRKLGDYKENIGVFLKFLARKLEFDYYLIKNPEVLNFKFHDLLEALSKKRIFFLKMFEKIKKKLFSVKSYQFYGLQLKRGKIIDDGKKLNYDFDEEVFEKNYKFLQNRIDLQTSENKDFIYYSNFKKFQNQNVIDIEIYKKYNNHFNKLQNNAINFRNQNNRFKKYKTDFSNNDLYNQIFDNKNNFSEDQFDLYKEIKKQTKFSEKDCYQNLIGDLNVEKEYENKKIKQKGMFFLSDNRILQEINFLRNKNLEKTKKQIF